MNIRNRLMLVLVLLVSFMGLPKLASAGACPIDWYSSTGQGQGSSNIGCMGCPVGSTTGGQTGQTACKVAKIGYSGTYSNNPANPGFTPCPQGSYADTYGQQSCKQASAGYFASTNSTITVRTTSAATLQWACSSNTTSNPGSSAYADCKPTKCDATGCVIQQQDLDRINSGVTSGQNVFPGQVCKLQSGCSTCQYGCPTQAMLNNHQCDTISRQSTIQNLKYNQQCASCGNSCN